MAEVLSPLSDLIFWSVSSLRTLFLPTSRAADHVQLHPLLWQGPADEVHDRLGELTWQK